jgi:hypothetical protein
MSLERFIKGIPVNSSVTILFREVEAGRANHLRSLVSGSGVFSCVEMEKVGQSYVLPEEELVFAYVQFSEGFPNLSMEVVGHSIVCSVSA